jgi:hypothetical protein
MSESMSPSNTGPVSRGEDTPALRHHFMRVVIWSGVTVGLAITCLFLASKGFITGAAAFYFNFLVGLFFFYREIARLFRAAGSVPRRDQFIMVAVFAAFGAMPGLIVVYASGVAWASVAAGWLGVVAAVLLLVGLQTAERRRKA